MSEEPHSTPFAELSPEVQRAVLERHKSGAWPVDRLLQLCAEQQAGTLYTTIGERLGCGKNAVVGKVRRLAELNILIPRPNPSIARPDVTDAMRRRRASDHQREMRRRRKGDDLRAYRQPGFATLAAGPVEAPLSPPVPKRLIPAALNHPLAPARPKPPRAIDAAESPRIPRYTPPPERHGPIIECSWPIGDPGTRDFRFCDEPSERGCSYCEDHNRLGHIRLRGHAAPLAGTNAVLAGSGPP